MAVARLMWLLADALTRAGNHRARRTLRRRHQAWANDQPLGRTRLP